MSVTSGRSTCYKQTEILLHLDYGSKQAGKKDFNSDTHLTCVLLSLKENSETVIPRMEADRKTDARLVSSFHSRLLDPNRKKKVTDYKPQIPLGELLTDIELDSAMSKAKKPLKVGNDLRIDKFQPYFKARCCEEFKIQMQNERLHSALSAPKQSAPSMPGPNTGFTGFPQQQGGFGYGGNTPQQQGQFSGGFNNHQGMNNQQNNLQNHGHHAPQGREEPVSLFRAPVTQPPPAPPPAQNNNQNNQQSGKDDKKKFVSPIAEKKKEEPKKDDEKYPVGLLVTIGT